MAFLKRSTKELSFEDAIIEFNNIKEKIERLLFNLGNDCDNLRPEPNDLEQDFLKNEYRNLAYKLESVYHRIDYLSKPIIEQGYIRYNKEKRFELPSGTYFTSGSTCEILYNDTLHNEQYWLLTTIEHNGKDYYAKSLGKDVCIEGMLVRVRG